MSQNLMGAAMNHVRKYCNSIGPYRLATEPAGGQLSEGEKENEMYACVCEAATI